MPRSLVPLAALGLVVAAAAPARAAPLRIVPVAGVEGEVLEAELVGVGAVPFEELRLVDGQGRVGLAVARGPLAATTPVAVAVVFNGQEVWIGNDGLEPPDSPAHYPGAFDGLRAAIAQLATSPQLPRGSEATLISYDETARTLAPMGPLAALAPALGDRRTYYSRIGTSLVSGVTAGLYALEASPLPRRVLIVIGDGNDTSADTAPDALAGLAARARDLGITVAAVVVKGALSDERTDVVALDPGAVTVAQPGDLPAALAALVPARIEASRVMFDAGPLMLDGAPRALQVMLRGQVIGAGVVAGRAAPAAPASSCGWWMQLAAGLGLVGLGALLVWWRVGRAPAA